MRNLRETLETIARRSPGWGTLARIQDPSTGQPRVVRVSYSAALRDLLRAPEPKPRADKGTGYATGRDGVRRVVRAA